MNIRTAALAALAPVVALGVPTAAHAEHPCTSPLILDLNGDGVRTVGLNWAVTFDINADGEDDQIGWTFKNGEEAFLWIDYNQNRVVDDGSELFGDSTPMPDGTIAEHGFDALSVYDRAEIGGNEDGLISREDLVFQYLRLWVDGNGDGVSQPSEIATLPARGVEAIGLDFTLANELDGAGNLHLLHGGFVRKVIRFGRPFTITQTVDDVVFVSSDN